MTLVVSMLGTSAVRLNYLRGMGELPQRARPDHPAAGALEYPAPPSPRTSRGIARRDSIHPWRSSKTATGSSRQWARCPGGSPTTDVLGRLAHVAASHAASDARSGKPAVNE